MMRHSNSPTSEEKLMAYIYDDVDDSDIFTFKPLQDNSDSGEDKAVSSKQQSELINENNELKDKVKTLEEKTKLLELRISEIYKTAKAEIERKDRRIQELNKEKDDIVFRRNRGANQYHIGANKDYQYRPPTHQSPEEKFRLPNATLENPVSSSSLRNEIKVEKNTSVASALTNKLSDDLKKPEVATKIVVQQTLEGNFKNEVANLEKSIPNTSRCEIKMEKNKDSTTKNMSENLIKPEKETSEGISKECKREKSKSPDIIILDDSDESDSEKSKTLSTCRVVVSKSEQKLVNSRIDAQSIKTEAKRPAARVTRSKSDYQPRHIRSPSPHRVKSPVFDKMLKRDNHTRSSLRNNKLPRTPPESPPRNRALLPKTQRSTSNSPSRRKNNSPPRRTIHNSKRTKSSCRNNSPTRRARSRSPPRSFRDRGRPRSIDRKRWMTDDNRKRSHSRGNDTREHRRERERGRHVEEAVKERNLKVDRHGNAIETYRDWKNKKAQEQSVKAKEDEEKKKISADQELAELFREGGGSETPLFGSENGSNFEDIQSEDEFEKTLNKDNKGNFEDIQSEDEFERPCSSNSKRKEEATKCRTDLNNSDLSESELERMLQAKLKELNSSEVVTSSPINVQISEKQEECHKSDLRAKKRQKSTEKTNQKKNGEVEELYDLNKGATKTQSNYGSIIEQVQKIRVRESKLLKNSVTDSIKFKTLKVTQVEETKPVEKNKKKIGIDDYKKRNEGKNTADDVQQEQTPVIEATELPDKPPQRIRIIEDRLLICAKTSLVNLTKTEPKQDAEIDIEAESNSLPGSGQDKGSFLNDFDFSLSEDEFIEKNVEKKSSMGESEVNDQDEQKIIQKRSENVSQEVKNETSVIENSLKEVCSENLNPGPKLSENNEPETECIENIQEAIHKSTYNPEPANMTRTVQLNTEELQKCLEDDDESQIKSSDKPKTVREQIILLFGSDSPATPDVKKMGKPRKNEAQKACRNLTNLGEDAKAKRTENESFKVRDKALESKKVPETTQLTSEEKPGLVFCNHPNYIPGSPNSRKKLADYIEKTKKDQPGKEEDEEELLDETSNNDEKKSSKTHKRKPFKIKMPFPNQEGKKQSKDNSPKKRKRPAKPKTVNSKTTKLQDDSFTNTVKKIVEAEKIKCTKPKKKKSKKSEQTLPQPCELNDSKEKSLKRITPIKVGEVSGNILVSSNKRKLITTEEERPDKVQKIDSRASQTSNQSPLPHMEEMLKNLERKAPPSSDKHVYTNIHSNTKLPKVPSEANPVESLNDNTINQIHLDSKDVSMLGANERVIFDNIHEYLGDKSLATFDTVDKPLNVQNKIKECSSHLDFSNMLHKSVTSTPLKPGLTTSTMTKSYLMSPLKRDKRRRIAIKVVDLPKT